MIKRISLTLLSLLCILFIIPFFIDVNSYKIPLLALVKEQTGISIRIDGDVKLSLLPMPHLNITDVAVENKTKNSSNDFVQLKKISLSIKWLPLLKKSFHIHDIELTEPTIFIDKYADGTINTTAFTEDSHLKTTAPLPQKVANPETPSTINQTIKLSVAKAKITNGTVRYTDHATQKKTIIKEINIDGDFNSTKGFDLKGRVISADTAATISVKGSVFSKGLPNIIEATLHLDSANTTSHVNGTLTLNATQKEEGIFTSTIASNALKIPFKITLGDQIINFEDGVKFSTNLIANDKKIDVIGFKALIGADLALSGKGTFAFNTKKAYGSIVVSSKGMNATSKFDVDLSKDKPFITATVHIPSFTHTHKNTAKRDKALSHRDQKAIESNDQKTTNGERWSKDLIDLSALKTVNGDFLIAIDKILYDDVKLTQTRLSFKIFDGIATIADLSTKTCEGSLNSTAIINSKTNHMSMKALVKDINIAELPGVKGSPLKGGRLTISTDIASLVSSMHNLVNNLSGIMKINMTDGVIEGFDIKQFVTDLKQTKDIAGITKLKASFDRKADMHFNKIHGDFKIINGIAQTTNFELNSHEGSVISRGSVDLPHWTINTASQIRIHQFNNIPYIMTYTKGTINQPDFSIDMSQLQEFLLKALTNQLVNRAKDNVKSQIKERVQGKAKEKAGSELAKKLGGLLPGLLGKN
jgi:uncharacterized protein involved in outer membrane biogenesis